MEQSDKERFRYLMAHPGYCTSKQIQQEAQELGTKIWNDIPRIAGKVPKKIQVIYNGKIVMKGTVDEIANHSSLAKTTIWNLARQNGTDSYGKSYRYVRYTMKLKDRKRIDRCVRQFVHMMNQADKEYPKTVSKGLIITEIFQENDWFSTMTYPAETIREEIEKQFDFYVGSGEK